MTHKLTYEETIEHLNAIVKTKPEGYCYEEPTCSYAEINADEGTADMNEPSCLVGHLLSDLGLLSQLDPMYNGNSVISLAHENNSVGRSIPGGAKSDAVSLFEDNFEEEALCALNRIQERQDGGYSWATAVSVDEPGVGWID